MASKLSSSLTGGSKKKRVNASERNARNRKFLPILIVPGLMSSGLEITESKTKPEWENERIWLNLSSLGISSMYFGSSQKRDKKDDDGQGDEEEYRQYSYKSAWLEHLMLAPDLQSDRPGIKVRPIKGLAGVDYLTPGAITSHLSYVFGPVIDALKKEGYNAEDGKINLMASPYDWRLAPMTMESRDQYFTRTLDYAEEMYRNNDSTPVVILGHSLGCKAAHYLLNFALNTRGQKWLDKYIHTYIPIGGPHLGAPKAMRGLIAGDKMGLETFLSDEEALAMGRNMGVNPWLMPSFLPEGVPAANYISPHGVLKISFLHALDADDLVRKRTGMSRPKRYQIMVVAKDFDGPLAAASSSERSIRTPFRKISKDLGANTVEFSDAIVELATAPKPFGTETLQFLLQEPGIASAKKEKESFKCNIVYCLCCICIPCMVVYRFLEYVLCEILLGSAAKAADKISGSAGGNTTLAFSERIKIPESVFKRRKPVVVKVPLYHMDDFGQFEGCLRAKTKSARKADLYVKLEWMTHSSTKSSHRICSEICEPSEDAKVLPIMTDRARNGNQKYQGFSGYDVCVREGLESTLGFIKDVYDGDPYQPRYLASFDAPPVRRVHAIYGINLPTEVGCVYTRADTCQSTGVLQSRYVPDRAAKLPKKYRGYTISNGVILETPKAKQVASGNVHRSGDGTVPYWSMARVKKWHGKDCRVTVEELEGAPHREILNDSRLHKALADYCISDVEQAK